MDSDSGGMASPGPQSQSSPMPPPQAPSPMGPPPPQQAPSPMPPQQQQPQQQGVPSPMGPPPPSASHHPHSPNSYQQQQSGPPPPGPAPQHINGPPNGGAMQQGTQTFQQHPPPPPPPPHGQVPQIFLEGYGQKQSVKVKTELHDVTTEYDLRIETLLIDTIASNFPTHKFLCEETKNTLTLTDEPTWIIDPIDGTINYTRKTPEAVICLALSIEKKVVLGVVCNPVTGQTFSALKGRGAFLNGERIRVSDVTEVKNALVGYEISMITVRRDKSNDFMRQFGSCGSKAIGMRSLGSCELSLCLVAMGSWDGYYVDYVKPWDVAAGSIILTEAGGSVFDTNGEEFDFQKGRIIAASNESLGHQLVEIFSL